MTKLCLTSLTLTHTQCWHAAHKTIGHGHLYQGRYESFPVQKDEHFLQLVRYVERNAKWAALVKKSEDWQWSSLYRRFNGTNQQKQLLSSWPIDPPKKHLEWVNTPLPKEEIEVILYALRRGCPYGDEVWLSHASSTTGSRSNR